MNKSKAFTALNTFASSRVKLIQALHDAGYSDLDDARAVVIEWVCHKMDAAPKVNKAGKVLLPSDHPKYEGMRKAVSDTMLMIQGTTRREASAKKEPEDAVTKLLKAYAKLSAAEQRKVAKLIGA